MIPSVTAYSTLLMPPFCGAVKRTLPDAVTRASAPAAFCPSCLGGDQADPGSPSSLSRQSGSTGRSRVPPAGTVQTWSSSNPSRRCGPALEEVVRVETLTVAMVLF